MENNKTYLVMAFVPTNGQAEGFGGGPLEWSGVTGPTWDSYDKILTFTRSDGRQVHTNLPVIIEEE